MKFSDKQKQAKLRGIHFDMSKETYANLLEQTHCFYSGIRFDDSEQFQMSFERMNGNIGYVDGNVVTVCRIINTAKGNMETEDEIDKQIEYFYLQIERNIKRLEKLDGIEIRLELIIEEWNFKYSVGSVDGETPFDFDLSRRTNVNKRKSINYENENYRILLKALPYAKQGIAKINSLTSHDLELIKHGLPLNHNILN